MSVALLESTLIVYTGLGPAQEIHWLVFFSGINSKSKSVIDVHLMITFQKFHYNLPRGPHQILTQRL